MIIINACFDVEPDTIATLTDALLSMSRASEAEDGCYAYRFSTELGAPGQLRLFERWEDEAALKAHFKTPHMEVFQGVLAEHPPKAVNVEVFDVTGEIPMPDVR